MRTEKRLALAVIVCTSSVLAAGAGDREADHEALRALRAKVAKAIVARDQDALAACLCEQFCFTSVDQTLLTSKDEIAAHFERMFGRDDSPLVSMTTQPEASILTRFLSDDVGYCYGTAKDTYTLRDAREVVMDNRWTVTLVKEKREWKVAAAHVGTNFLDNPVLDRVVSSGRKLALGALVAGLVVGVLLGRLSSRRRGGTSSDVPEAADAQ